MKYPSPEIIRALIDDNLFPLDSTIAPDADLHEEGLDSLALMQLILLLESEFSISIRPEDLDRENFSTLGQISALISGKRNK